MKRHMCYKLVIMNFTFILLADVIFGRKFWHEKASQPRFPVGIMVMTCAICFPSEKHTI